MASPSWKQIRSIFEEASIRPDAERAAYLDSACADNSELRSEVESLLASLDQAGQFLEPPQTGAYNSSRQLPQQDLLIGKHIGPYRIESLIGHGGMGAVYKAVRDDGQFQKQVAIKLVQPGIWSSELAERFTQEKRTLARLEHPNIAAVIDGGATDEGVPFLIMEFVDGVPVDEFCDKNRLTISERLELFQHVCAAVQYAHQNLVIHRDLKPGNILVNALNTPKLLDFGIAKLLDDTQSEGPVDATRVGLRFITYEYASPEQIRGEPVTTASDVYSLGVLLYKLLTGRSPYDFKSRLPHDMTHTICEQEPIRPSTSLERPPQPSSMRTHEEASTLRSVTPDKLRRQLSGDLDNIILKSLQKDPDRRYSSVEQFAEDLRRHRVGLPVLARSDSFKYRVGKFMRRHAIGVLATSIIVLAIAGGIVTTTWQARKATRESAKAERISDFLKGMLSSADPARDGKDVTVVQTLDRAVERVGKELAVEPEIAASVLHTIGETYLALGEYQKADENLKHSLMLYHQLFGERDEQVSTVLHSMAFLAQLRSEQSLADSLYGAAIATHRQTASKPDMHLASMLSDYGSLLRELGETDKALNVLHESLDISGTISGKNTRAYAVTLTNLGSALQDKGDLTAADSVFRLGINIMKRQLGEEHIDVAQALNNLVFVLVQEGRDDEAEDLSRESLAIRKKVLGPDHPEVALGLANLAGLLLMKEKIDEAEQLSLESLRLFKATVNPDNLRISSSLFFLGRIANIKGDPLQAEQYLNQALDIRKKNLPPGHPAVVSIESELGRSLLLERKFVRAERMLSGAYQTLLASMGESHPTTVATQKYLVELYRNWGKPDKMKLYER